MTTRCHVRPSAAPSQLIAPGKLRHLSLALLQLKPGEKVRRQSRVCERVLVLLQGECRVRSQGKVYHMKRDSVFAERATALYLPAGVAYELTADATSELAECRCRSPIVAGAQVHLVTSDQVSERLVGQDSYFRRVYDIVDSRVPASRILVGETLNPAGHWSSFPPHKHDRARLPIEAKMEEIYYYRLSPPDGFAFQGLYGENGAPQQAYILQHGDVVGIPRGYHPVSAMPGYELYYLWFLGGEGRQMAPFTDPRYEWIMQPARKS